MSVNFQKLPRHRQSGALSSSRDQCGKTQKERKLLKVGGTNKNQEAEKHEDHCLEEQETENKKWHIFSCSWVNLTSAQIASAKQRTCLVGVSFLKAYKYQY